MYPYINILGRDVGLYGLMALLGALVCGGYLYITYRGGKAGRLRGDDLLHVLLLAVLGAMVGAKVLSIVAQLPIVIPLIVQNWEVLRHHPMDVLVLLAGGMVFYGGFIGGAVAVFWYCRRYNVSIKVVCGIFTPAVPLFHTFGRIGCFLGGCCFGIPVSWGVVYPEHSPGAPSGIPLLPIQLIEAGCNFILFIVLAIVSRRLRPARKWMTLPVYMVCYGVLRFVLEFFRGDIMRGVYLLSTSQWISLALVVGSLVMYFARWRKMPDDAPVLPFKPKKRPIPVAEGPGQPGGQDPPRPRGPEPL